MSVSFRSFRLQLTTAAEYRMTGTAKVLIAVTLFLLESLLLRIRLTRFLYSEHRNGMRRVLRSKLVEKKVFSYPTMGGVILRLGTLPEPWESENTPEDLRRS